MTRALNRCAAALAMSTALSGCLAPDHPMSTAQTLPVVQGVNETQKTLDALNQALARDAQDSMGWVDNDKRPWPDYDVQVYKGGPSIGTLLVGDQVHLVNNTACKPKKDFVSQGSINVFASYEIDGSTAVTLGLPIPQLPLGANYGRDVKISYALDDAQLSMLPDDELGALLAAPDCAKRVAQISKEQRAWIVRGLISAKRAYSFYVKRTGGASLVIPGVTATNSVTTGGSVKGFGTDSGSRTYFMILKPLWDTALPSPTPIAPDVTVRSACGGAMGNKIYIQRDKTDAAAAGSDVAAALRQARFRPDPTIQGIDPDRMTPTSVVRYFWEDDKAAAVCATGILRANGYPNAKAAMLPLASPKGQLEVWLTKSRN